MQTIIRSVQGRNLFEIYLKRDVFYFCCRRPEKWKSSFLRPKLPILQQNTVKNSENQPDDVHRCNTMALTLYTFFRCRKSATDVLIKLIQFCLYRRSIEFTPPSTCQDDCCVGTVNSSSGGLKKFSSKRAAPPGRIWRLVLPTRLSNSRRSFPSLFFFCFDQQTERQSQESRHHKYSAVLRCRIQGVRLLADLSCTCTFKSSEIWPIKGRIFSFCGSYFRFAPLRNLFVFAWILFVWRLFFVAAAE